MANNEELKRLAEAATPGPWAVNRHGAIVGGLVQQFFNGSGQSQIAMSCGAEWMRDGEILANAEFIAAANPAVVLALIAENERLRDSTVSVDTTVYIAEELSVQIDQIERERDRLKAENEALKGRLEVDDRHPYDGIDCRDETINGLQEQAGQLKAELERVRADLSSRDALLERAVNHLRLAGYANTSDEIATFLADARAALGKGGRADG